MSLLISNKKLAIGIPNSWNYVPAPFFDSFIQMERPNFVYCPAKNGPIHQLRNNIVEQALGVGASHLLFMDTDQIYPKDTIPKLLSHKLPVVHAPVYRRYPPFDSLMLKGDINNYYAMVAEVDFQVGELVEVSAIGTGCVLYDMQVFHKTKPPWFEFVPNPDKKIGGLIGEDIGFCLKLKKAGYKIFVDTSIHITHLAVFGVDENFSFLYQSLVKRQRILDKKD